VLVLCVPCQVVSGFDLLSGGDCLVETFPEVGLAAVSAPEPLHYYSLFSHTIGCDVVVSGAGCWKQLSGPGPAHHRGCSCCCCF
jgi:hypothetical protein